jgi:putative heme iron utilization protein
MNQPANAGEGEKKVIRDTNDEARTLARDLIAKAPFAAIGVLEPASGVPLVSRIAIAADEHGGIVFLASTLSGHTKALGENPVCSVLVGEPGKGDPLAHPRMTVIGKAVAVPRPGEDHARLRAMWLKRHPKAQTYIDFGDFNFWRIEAERAHLNGGFGKAFILEPGDFLHG